LFVSEDAVGDCTRRSYSSVSQIYTTLCWLYTASIFCTWAVTYSSFDTYKLKRKDTAILHVILCACETRSHLEGKTWIEYVWEQRRIFGPAIQEVTEGWRKYIMRSFIFCTLLQVLLGRSH